MDTNKKMKITQELLQIMKQFERMKWAHHPFRDLKPSECELLGTLYLNLSNGIEVIAASELSKQLNITPAGVTHLINPLEKSDYIERLPDPNDRRVVLIGLTDKGKVFAERFISEVQEKLVGLVDYLGDEESQAFIRLMSSVISYLGSLKESNRVFIREN